MTSPSTTLDSLNISAILPLPSFDDWIALDASLTCRVGPGQTSFGEAEVYGELMGNLDELCARVAARLHAGGYHLPLGLIRDLAEVYWHPEAAAFAPSAAWRAAGQQDKAERYCELLSETAASPSWRNLLVRARRRRRRWARGLSSDEKLHAEQATFDFLTQVASQLHAVGETSPNPLPAPVVNGIAERPWTWPRSSAGDLSAAALRKHVGHFLEYIAPVLDERSDRPLEALFQSETTASLLLADAGFLSGSSRLCLPLWEACQTYQPPQLTAGMIQRWRRIQQALSNWESNRASTPEEGVRGIRRRGPLSALLPSELVHDDWTDRVMTDQALYLDQYVPKTERQRVLFAWVIDWSGAMRSRTNVQGHWRRDVIARWLVALMAEDAVRYLANSPALQPCHAVLFLNGQSETVPSGYRDQVFVLTPNQLERAPGPVADAQADAAWLAREESFFPEYFFREPNWARPLESDVSGMSGIQPNMTLDDHSARMIRAMTRLVTVANCALNQFEDHAAGGLAACHVTLLSADPLMLERTSPARAVLAREAAVVSWQRIHVGYDGARWLGVQEDRTESKPHDGYADFPDSTELRVPAWNSLLDVLTLLA